MKFVTSESLRKAEEKAIAKDNSLALSMMNRAGKGLAMAIRRIAAQMGQPASEVRLLAGPGNNGGDAFAAALYLREAGLIPQVWLVGQREKLRGSALAYFEEMVKERIPWREMQGEKAWSKEAEASLSPLILVDALLGTGAKGEPMGDIRRAVEYLKSKHPFSMIVSADIPTGMNADTGTRSPTVALIRDTSSAVSRKKYSETCVLPLIRSGAASAPRLCRVTWAKSGSRKMNTPSAVSLARASASYSEKFTAVKLPRSNKCPPSSPRIDTVPPP